MKQPSTMNRQRGAALLVALMILLIVSVIGISAMRSSSFSAKVAMGTQLDAMAFEAAETAIGQTLDKLLATDAQSTDDVNALMNGGVLVWCITSGGSIVKTCTAADVMDSRGMVVSEARSMSTGFRRVSGNQLSQTGGGSTTFVDFELTVQGNGELPSYALLHRHIQHAMKRGMFFGADTKEKALEGGP